MGPLTAFDAPPTCTIAVQECRTCAVAKLGQGCDAAAALSCLPPTSRGAPQMTALSEWGFYSPAVACPAGHAAACTATAGGTSQWPVQFKLSQGETAIGCCPRYVHQNQSCS
jgi:hypothetical protein